MAVSAVEVGMPSPSPKHPIVAEIMVVDDDADVREAVGEFLSQAGYETTSARDGAEALGQLLLGKCNPALIILDLDMPIMDGREFLCRIAREESLKRLPVIVLSAAAPCEGLHEEISVVSKPITGDRLLAEIRASLAPPGARQSSAKGTVLSR